MLRRWRDVGALALAVSGCTSDGTAPALDTDVDGTAPAFDTDVDGAASIPDCHYDCFGGLRCENGVVSAYAAASVPCEYWTGECPASSVIEPVQCQYGCLLESSSRPIGTDPLSLCQPCEDPTKTGPECDQCADPTKTGPDCTTCIDPQTHGPNCDLCLGVSGSNGCPCAEHADCLYQICLEGLDGRRCAKGCSRDEECPEGFVCSLEDTGYQSACTPVEGYLCKSCSTDEDCELPGHWNVLCADIGLAEKRCTRLCDRLCPDGFSCTRVEWRGSPADVCVPDTLASCE